jgi:hypothetical protein
MIRLSIKIIYDPKACSDKAYIFSEEKDATIDICSLETTVYFRKNVIPASDIGMKPDLWRGFIALQNIQHILF